MAVERKPQHNFNTETMSGIYPGSRTMIYQRLRLQAIHVEPSGQQGAMYQLQWYTDPTAAILLPTQGDTPALAPLITLTEPQTADLTQRLHDELAAVGLQADACFACRHWYPLNIHTDDALPAGRCRWNDPDSSLPGALATQSALSLACDHFQRQDQPPRQEADVALPFTTLPRVRKLAELDPDRLPFWPRLWYRVKQRFLPRRAEAQTDWADQVIERSGVGAGTEPCFVCQGRLANLGALAVASPEGDKQTLSVWRCRSCYTTYFNDWTDRWERLESLETEERYFRIAPAEAYTALSVIRATKGGDHPGRRAERRPQREQILALVAGKTPLSHQIRQGR